MIGFLPASCDTWELHSVRFDEEGMGKLRYWLSRAANTYHDKELTELLDQIKSYQEKS